MTSRLDQLTRKKAPGFKPSIKILIPDAVLIVSVMCCNLVWPVDLQSFTTRLLDVGIAVLTEGDEVPWHPDGSLILGGLFEVRRLK